MPSMSRKMASCCASSHICAPGVLALLSCGRAMSSNCLPEQPPAPAPNPATSCASSQSSASSHRAPQALCANLPKLVSHHRQPCYTAGIGSGESAKCCHSYSNFVFGLGVKDAVSSEKLAHTGHHHLCGGAGSGQIGHL